MKFVKCDRKTFEKKIDEAARAVKAKFEEDVRDKNRCCWEQLETDELVAMLRGHIDKFEERGSSNRRDAADLIGIGIMVFHKCAEGEFKYLDKGGKDA